MDQNIIKELKENIKPKLEAEVTYLNDRQVALDRISKAYQALASKDVATLIDKCNYKMGSLVNAHRFSSVANQEYVERDTSELNQLVADLNNEILDIENIGIEMGKEFDEPKYQEFSNEIKSNIDRTLNACNETVRKATDVLSYKFDSVDLTGAVEAAVEETQVNEEIEEEIQPTELNTDTIEELENDLNKNLQPIHEDKKELEEIKKDLDSAEKVTSVEPIEPQAFIAPMDSISPVLQPETQTDLNAFLSNGPKEEREEVPTIDEIKARVGDIKSASNVDEGPVLVTNVETFDLNSDREAEGPVLSRTA